jgi:signal-transduction protein with cAMP-binding, CBS, and nucleotidyltransferase domain
MIKDLNIERVQNCTENDSIVEVAKLLKEAHARHVYVVNKDQNLKGIISSVDIANKVVAEGKDPKTLKASDVMNSPVDAVELNQETEFALKIMMSRNTFHCPVLDCGKLVGTVSYNDVFTHVGKKITGGN